MYRKIKDLTVSTVALGADGFGSWTRPELAERLLDAYVDFGGNLIDTANVYGRWAGGNLSEQFLGDWMRRTGKRPIIATKGGHYDLKDPSTPRLGAADIRRDLEESLRTLGLETLDLYWLHRDDPSRPVGEILETMEIFVREGKIRYYGASNYRAERLAEAHVYARVHGLSGFMAASNQHSLARINPGRNLNPDPTLVICDKADLDYHRITGLPLMPYQSTARGYFGKLAQNAPISGAMQAAYGNDHNRAVFETLRARAEEEGCSVQTMALVALTEENFPVVPITSVRREDHLQDIFDAMRRIKAD